MVHDEMTDVLTKYVYVLWIERMLLRVIINNTYLIIFLFVFTGMWWLMTTNIFENSSQSVSMRVTHNSLILHEKV